MTVGRIHSYETLGALDGPGLRIVVFLQGCPCRCGYCHNPDTWDPTGGNEVTPEDVMRRIRRCRPYFGTGGGVTLSGGEPLLQADFAAEILETCAREGIHSAIDTAGFRLNRAVERAITACALVILDIKHADSARFHVLTGCHWQGMLDVLELTRRLRKPTWIRQVIVPGWNDTPGEIEALVRLIGNHPGLERVELLPYHTMGKEKWQALGRVSPFADVAPLNPEAIAPLRQYLGRLLAETGWKPRDR